MYTYRCVYIRYIQKTNTQRYICIYVYRDIPESEHTHMYIHTSICIYIYIHMTHALIANRLDAGLCRTCVAAIARQGAAALLLVGCAGLVSRSCVAKAVLAKLKCRHWRLSDHPGLKVCFPYCARGKCAAGDDCPLRHPPKEDAAAGIRTRLQRADGWQMVTAFGG